MKILATVALCLLSSTVLAEDLSPKIDFTTVLTDTDGKAINECLDFTPPRDDKDCKTGHGDITLGLVATRSLVIPEQGMSPEVSLQRGQLGLSIYKNKTAVLSADDISMIKKQIAKAYGPLIVLRAFTILDPNGVKTGK